MESKHHKCDLCNQTFKQKKYLLQHQNRGIPCVPPAIQIKSVENNSKTKLGDTLRECLFMLRDDEGLFFDTALKNLSYLLVLKLIEPHIGNEMCIEDYKNELLQNLRFSIFSKEKVNILENLINLRDDILSVHPATKNIFLTDCKFDIYHDLSYIKIFDALNSFEVSEIDYNILSSVYEKFIHFMSKTMYGEMLSEVLVKKLMVKLIDPILME